MGLTFRLSASADLDVFEILQWSHEHFGEAARRRYEALITDAIIHAASSRGGVGFRVRPELGEGVVSWHLAVSAQRAAASRVRHPRHVLLCRWDGDVLVVGRILHESMDPSAHLDHRADWA